MSTSQTARICLLLWVLWWGIASSEQSLDSSVSEFAKSVQASDSRQALTSLRNASIRLAEIYKQVGSATKPASQAITSIGLASKILAQEPTTRLETLVAAIKKDTEHLAAIDPKIPEFGNPLDGISITDLQNSDPSIRGKALDFVRSQGGRLKSEFAATLSTFRAERDKAIRSSKDAHSTDRIGFEIENILSELNSVTPTSTFLNIGGGQLTYTLLDITLHVRPALADRLTAANHLVKRYETVIRAMEQTLGRYNLFEEWAGYYRWQDWARVSFSNQQSDAITPTGALERSRELISNAREDSDHLANASRSSRNEDVIRALTNETIAKTNATQERADELIRTAAKLDAKAASMNEFAALVNLAASIYGAAQPSQQATGQQKPQQPEQLPRQNPQPPRQKPPSRSPPLIIHNNATFNVYIQVPSTDSTVQTPKN